MSTRQMVRTKTKDYDSETDQLEEEQDEFQEMLKQAERRAQEDKEVEELIKKAQRCAEKEKELEEASKEAPKESTCEEELKEETDSLGFETLSMKLTAEETYDKLEELRLENERLRAQKRESILEQEPQEIVISAFIQFAKDLIFGHETQIYKKNDLTPVQLKSAVRIPLRQVIFSIVSESPTPLTPPPCHDIFYFIDPDEHEKEVIHAYDGSVRCNLKVSGKYPNDEWLLLWDIAFHGTSQLNAIGIAKTGFDKSKCVRELYGPGIYCTPDPRIALDYAKSFEYHSHNFKLVIQTFVDPKKKKMANEEFKYWRLEEENAIRPRAIWVYPA